MYCYTLKCIPVYKIVIPFRESNDNSLKTETNIILKFIIIRYTTIPRMDVIPVSILQHFLQNLDEKISMTIYYR